MLLCKLSLSSNLITMHSQTFKNIHGINVLKILKVEVVSHAQWNHQRKHHEQDDDGVLGVGCPLSNGMIVVLAAVPELGEDDPLSGGVEAGAAAARAQPAALGAVAAVQLVPVAAHLQQRTLPGLHRRLRCPTFTKQYILQPNNIISVQRYTAWVLGL